MSWTGHTDRSYLKTVGPDADYYVVLSEFNLAMAKTIPAIKQVNDLYVKKFGHDITENAVRSFNAPFVLADAINRAGSTNPDAIEKALETTNMGAGIMPWKGIQFDQNHQNKYASLVLQQRVKGELQTVWPGNVATMQIVGPFPAGVSSRGRGPAAGRPTST